MTLVYNVEFYGNILVVGRTNCGKTTFIEKLGLNNFFGDIIKTEWISGTDIEKQREAEIKAYFKNETEVHIAQEQDKLDSLIETFKQWSHENSSHNVNNSFGENRKLYWLIIIDDVSGVANVSKKFANFLTAKANIWLWMNRVSSDLANSHEKHCLTIDCGYLNKIGPGRYRSSADNTEKQVCYFHKPGDDVFYNTFMSERIKEDKYKEGIYLKIEKVRGNNDKENFDAKRNLDLDLEDGLSDARTNGVFSDSKPPEQNGAGTKIYGDSFEHLYRKRRRSAKPKFLSG